MLDQVFQTAERKMKRAVEALQHDLSAVRTGRASPALLERVQVEYYGSPTPLNGVAQISVPEPRMLVIQPWDKKILGPLEKAIQKADLGAMPVNDGNLIRLTMPALSGERRQEIVKSIRKESETQRVAVRNVRRDANEKLKKLEKDHVISEDEHHRYHKEIQDLTDNSVKDLEDLLVAKEKEILEF